MSRANKQAYNKCFGVFDGVQQRDAARGRRVSRQNLTLCRGLAGGDEHELFRNLISKFKPILGRRMVNVCDVSA